MTGYIIQGIVAILTVGISAGFLARRKKPRITKGTSIPFKTVDPDLYSKHSTDSEGNQRWTNGLGQIHRKDGPAIIWNWGTKDWYLNGKRHREDGPATEYAEGGKSWALNDKVFLTEETWKKELNKPKCTTDFNGCKRWHNKEGQLHREDGPAYEGTDGKTWYINGKLHREDGHAVEYADGRKAWYLNGEHYSEERWKKELNKPKCDTDNSGNKYWKNKEGQLHREDGPAVEWANGVKEWCINGKMHREDGPAHERPDGKNLWYLDDKNYSEETWKKELDKPICKTDDVGNKFWYNKEGKQHREDGPARDHADGTKSWWINGKRHREDGPAIEFKDGTKQWWLNDAMYTEEEWKKELEKPTETCNDGTRIWKNKYGQYHREDGPAYENSNGFKAWWINGKRHREDGPALERSNGTKEWYLNGKYYTEKEWKKELDKPTYTTDSCGTKNWHKDGLWHREDGPAREQVNGIKSWWINGKRHREDGPAIERPDGTSEWWLNDKFLTEEQWKKELGKPICVTDTAFNKRWYKGNKFHREDGPAIEYSNGNKSWYLNGMYHTEEQWKQEVSKLARS